MSILDELSVEHDYYCSDLNYYSNDASKKFETMSEFLDEFENAAIDLNLCFRWDINPRGENGREHGRYYAEVFLMLQRKGIFMPIHISHVNESEAERFKDYAHKHWEYLGKIWNPISDQKVKP